MNIIEEFMKRYQQLVEDYSAKKLDDEQYAAALISMTSQAMGLSRRVRASHLKALAAMIFQAVDKERQAACARCEQPLEVYSSKEVPYCIEDLRDVAYRARAAIHAVLHAHNHDVPKQHYPNMAVVQMERSGPRVFMKRSDTGEVIYSFAVGKSKSGQLRMRDPLEAIATDYIIRHKMGTFV